MSLLPVPDSTAVDGDASATDRGIEAGIRSVVFGDGTVEPGDRRNEPIRGHPNASDRGSADLPVARHHSMSLLQAPNSAPVEGGASAAEDGILPVVSDDGIVEPGVRGDKPVCNRVTVSDRGIDGGPLPVARHISISLLQAPNSTPVDAGAGVVGTGIGASILIAYVDGSMPGPVRVFLLVDAIGVEDAVSGRGAGAALMSTDATGFAAGDGGFWLLIRIALAATAGGRRT
jgi:hypothetical protein